MCIANACTVHLLLLPLSAGVAALGCSECTCLSMMKIMSAAGLSADLWPGQATSARYRVTDRDNVADRCQLTGSVWACAFGAIGCSRPVLNVCWVVYFWNRATVACRHTRRHVKTGAARQNLWTECALARYAVVTTPRDVIAIVRATQRIPPFAARQAVLRQTILEVRIAPCVRTAPRSTNRAPPHG